MSNSQFAWLSLSLFSGLTTSWLLGNMSIKVLEISWNDITHHLMYIYLYGIYIAASQQPSCQSVTYQAGWCACWVGLIRMLRLVTNGCLAFAIRCHCLRSSKAAAANLTFFYSYLIPVEDVAENEKKEREKLMMMMLSLSPMANPFWFSDIFHWNTRGHTHTQTHTFFAGRLTRIRVAKFNGGHRQPASQLAS